jgi:sec-independent protein translocase protein TatA
MNLSPAFIEGLGGPEMLLIMFIVLLLFGADKLPELARGIGKSVREFKKAASGVEEEVRRAMEEEPVKPAPKPTGTIQQQAGAPKPPATPLPPAAD